MESYLGIDIGTSSVKALLVDRSQRILAEDAQPLVVSRPRPLWSEQDPEAWWRACLGAIDAVRAAAPQPWQSLRGIGLSGQMHGATLLDGGGRVLRPAILWNDGRSFAECAELQRRVPDLTSRAANLAMPGFTAPKLLWVKTHEPEVFAATRMVLLPKDYIRYRLTGAFVSEMSDAAGTLWLDVANRRWDDVLLGACELSRKEMPALVEGSERSAQLSRELAARLGLASAAVPVAGGGGDNAASAVGIGAVKAGEGFLSLGTSGVIFAVTDRLAARPERTLHAFCHAVPGRWHGMAVMLSAASALSWIAGLVGAGDDFSGLLERVAAFATDRDAARFAPIFLPYLSGERTPHNDAEATGLFAGLRAEHGAEALTYAVLEGVAFAFADGLAVLSEAGARLDSCLLVGGGARSSFWAQMLADVLGLTLDLPEGAEIGAAFGAARLAILAAGDATEEEVCTKPAIRHSFAPNPQLGEIFRPRLARFRALYPAEKATRNLAG
ncbi:MAG: xylulokinase [Methylobacteriaceae bacterium]|nr:xylulokinase [Methylobacteriaceae bacterium]